MDSKDSSLFCYESHFILFPNLHLAERCPLSIENRPTVFKMLMHFLILFIAGNDINKG